MARARLGSDSARQRRLDSDGWIYIQRLTSAGPNGPTNNGRPIEILRLRRNARFERAEPERERVGFDQKLESDSGPTQTQQKFDLGFELELKTLKNF